MKTNTFAAYPRGGTLGIDKVSTSDSTKAICIVLEDRKRWKELHLLQLCFSWFTGVFLAHYPAGCVQALSWVLAETHSAQICCFLQMPVLQSKATALQLADRTSFVGCFLLILSQLSHRIFLIPRWNHLFQSNITSWTFQGGRQCWNNQQKYPWHSLSPESENT